MEHRAFSPGCWRSCPRCDFLPKLDAIDRTLLAQVGKPWRAAVVASGLGRAGLDARNERGCVIRMNVKAFVDSIARLTWAKSNGAPWAEWTALYIAQVGDLEVLKWARRQGIEWDENVCA